MAEGILGLADGTLKRMPQRHEEGRQYFVMHERLKRIVQRKIDTDSTIIISTDSKSDSQLSLF